MASCSAPHNDGGGRASVRRRQSLTRVRGSFPWIQRVIGVQANKMTPTASRAPGQFILFSGHMIDAADRKEPRFPPGVEGVAAGAIAAALAELNASASDIGITEGACGGDLLFSEALLARGASLELRLPFRQAEFIEKSVAFAKKTPPPDRWLERFRKVARHERVTVREMPDEADLPTAEDPYEQCNLWMLRDALTHGAKRASIICLWNGSGGDGPGGTAHMMKSVEDAGGRSIWLDTSRLWGKPIRARASARS